MGKRLYILLHNESTGDSLTLPLNPESIDISTERDINTHNILNYGEVPVIGYEKLQKLSLNSLLPDDVSYFALLSSLVEKLKHKPYTKQRSIAMLEDWVKAGKPIRVVIAGDTYEDINKEFYFTKFNKQLRESTADIKGTIELTEYKNPNKTSSEYETIRKKIGKKIVKLIPRSISKYIPSSMTMQQGATLYKIAKKVYGEAASHSEALAKLNGIFDRNKDLAGEIIDMIPLDKVEKL